MASREASTIAADDEWPNWKGKAPMLDHQLFGRVDQLQPGSSSREEPISLSNRDYREKEAGASTARYQPFSAPLHHHRGRLFSYDQAAATSAEPRFASQPQQHHHHHHQMAVPFHRHHHHRHSATVLTSSAQGGLHHHHQQHTQSSCQQLAARNHPVASSSSISSTAASSRIVAGWGEQFSAPPELPAIPSTISTLPTSQTPPSPPTTTSSHPPIFRFSTNITPTTTQRQSSLGGGDVIIPTTAVDWMTTRMINDVGQDWRKVGAMGNEDGGRGEIRTRDDTATAMVMTGQHGRDGPCLPLSPLSPLSHPLLRYPQFTSSLPSSPRSVLSAKSPPTSYPSFFSNSSSSPSSQRQQQHLGRTATDVVASCSELVAANNPYPFIASKHGLVEVYVEEFRGDNEDGVDSDGIEETASNNPNASQGEEEASRGTMTRDRNSVNEGNSNAWMQLPDWLQNNADWLWQNAVPTSPRFDLPHLPLLNTFTNFTQQNLPAPGQLVPNCLSAILGGGMGAPLDEESNADRGSFGKFGKQRKQQQQQTRPTRYDVFLGGSCGNTVWRSELVIPYLKKHGITYYDPQRPVWSENLIYEEAMAKENSRLFLFVLDPGTINATSFLEIAYFAARKAVKLVVVFLGRHEWSDKAHPLDLPDRIRTCNLLEAILKRHSVPMLNSINAALDFVDEKIIGRKSWSEAMTSPKQRVPFLRVKARSVLANSRRSFTKATHLFNYRRLAVFCGCATALLILQAAILLLLLTANVSLPGALSIWWLLAPFIGFDYAVLVALLLVARYRRTSQQHERHYRHISSSSTSQPGGGSSSLPSRRAINLPPIPIPRVNSSTFSSGCGANYNAFEPATLYKTITSELELDHHPDRRSGSGGGVNRGGVGLRSSKSHVDFGLLRLRDVTENEQESRGGEPAGRNHHCVAGFSSLLHPLASVAGAGKPPLPPASAAFLGVPSAVPVFEAGGCHPTVGRLSRRERMQMHGCLSSPIGYDVFLSCSSASELDWITQKAIPQLHKSGLSYTSALMYDLDKELRIPPLHTASHLLYYIPSYRTFLSGMIEIAYFIGHEDWQVTVCIPKEAECLVYLSDVDGGHGGNNGEKQQIAVDVEAIKAIQRRNECYRMAFCYLKDLAQRQQCRVFTNVEDAIRHIAKQQQQMESETEVTTSVTDGNSSSPTHSNPTAKKAALWQILAKQHLVRERTQANLLAHLKAKSASTDSTTSGDNTISPHFTITPASTTTSKSST